MLSVFLYGPAPLFWCIYVYSDSVFTDHFLPFFSKQIPLLTLQLTELVSQASKLALGNPFTLILQVGHQVLLDFMWSWGYKHFNWLNHLPNPSNLF